MAKKSTGPRSAEGKARSSMNALKTGIYSKSLLIPGEDSDDLDALTADYHQRFQPADAAERDLVDSLVRSSWSLRRFAVAETQIFNYEMDTAYHLNEEAPVGHAFIAGSRNLERLQRIVNAPHRNYRIALHELEHLQASRPPQSPAAPGPI